MAINNIMIFCKVLLTLVELYKWTGDQNIARARF